MKPKKVSQTYMIFILILTFMLKTLIPGKAAQVLFLVLAAGIFIILAGRMQKARPLKHKMLILLLAVALVFRIVFPLAHTFVPDDFWIMEQSKNFMLHFEPNNCFYTPELEESCYSFKTIGYPIMLSAPFLTFGLNNYVALSFNSIISLMIIALTYFVVLEFTSNRKKAIITATLMTFSLQLLISSNHVESVIPALILFLSSTLFFLRYHREKNHRDNIAAISLFLMMIITRAEYAALIFIPIYIYAKNIFSGSDEKKTAAISIALVVLVSALIVLLSSQDLGSVSIVMEQNRISVTLASLKDNIENITDHYGFARPIIITIGLLAGLLMTFRKNKKSFIAMAVFIPIIVFYAFLRSSHIKETILLAIIMSYFYIAELLFYADEKTQNKKDLTRYASKIVIIIIVVVFVVQGIQVKSQIESSSLMSMDTGALRIITVPEDCFLITERPSYVTATTSIKVIRTDQIYDSRELIGRYLSEGKCIMFFENSFCYQDLDIGPGRDRDARSTRARCSAIKRNYELEEFSAYRAFDKEYIVYKITGVK